jgi:hypothetical protein
MATFQADHTASATLRAHVMTVAARAVVGSIRRRQRDFLADPRSVLDRPVLADTTDPVVAAFVVAYDEAVETLGECTPDHPRCAARALSAAHAAEYAASLADQHARRLARHGIYPHLRGPLDVRGLDLVEEARASLEFAAHAWPASAATRHCRRAAQLAEEVGIAVPDLLIPAWQALLDEPETAAAALSSQARPVEATAF